ncbi:MAG: hypothetical protein WBX19_21835 [Terracidiphilus sp.]
MKNLAIALLALTSFAAAALAQELPSAPAPAADPAWSRLQNLQNGQPVIVTTVDNRSIHCLFAGVTDAYLFCNPPGNPPDTGFRFDRAQVLSVDRDWPGQARPKAASQRNYHPAWIASMIAGGIIVGLIASQGTDAGKATEDGFIGAGIVGLIGAPLAFLPHPQIAPPGSAYPPYAFGTQLRLPFHSHIRY